MDIENIKDNAIDFKIFNDATFARGKTKKGKAYICYGSVICHALHHAMHHNQAKEVEPLVSRLYQAVEHNKAEENEIICLYPFTAKDNQGYIVIDKSKGCYPLFCDSEKKWWNKTKYEGLKYVVQTIEKNQSSILKKLSQYPEWNNQLQTELQSCYFDLSAYES